MKNIKADIKNNTYKRIYLLFGEEVYLMRRCLASLKQGVLGDGTDDVNYSHFDGSNGYNVNELKELCETLPFFADRRLIVVENSGLFKSDSGFIDFLPQIADTTVLIIVESSVDKRNALYKAIEKAGYVCEFTTPDPAQLLNFAAGHLGSFDKRISQADCQYFINSVGGDLYNIITELDKLIDYTGERTAVTREDIDTVCSLQIEKRLFDLVDALVAHDRATATRIYFDLIALHEQPLGLLRIMMKQYLRLITIRDEMDRGSSDRDIGSSIHAGDWVARKYRAQLKNVRKSSLSRAVELCTDTEEAIKSGNISETIGMEILLAKLSAL